MDHSPEKESSEIKLIRSHTKTISEIEDPLWIFTGKPNYRQQNSDESDNRFERHSIKNLLNLNKTEIEKIITNISPETLEIESHMLDYPFSAVGIINITYTDYTSQIGCGTLIMPGVVITCANLICNLGKKEISKIKFYCNYDEIQCLFKFETEIAGYFFPDDFENGFLLEDYAIMVLKKPLGTDTGHLGILPFNNLDRNVDFVFCSFDFLKDENIIGYLEQKKLKMLEMEENDGNFPPCDYNYKKSKKKLLKSNFSYFGDDNKTSFYDYRNNVNSLINNRNPNTYFYPETLEGEVRVKENTILHKYNIFNKIPGCPILVEKDKLPFINKLEESMKNKNYPLFIYSSNNNLELNNSMISINESNKNSKQEKKNTSLLDRPEYYLVGICTGKSDSIFNRATLICRKRFENIKSWIINFAKRSGKIQKQMILNLESNYIDDMFVENFLKIDLEEITNLILKDNTIRVDGVSTLSKANFKNLIELDLSNNDIKDSGLKIICKSKTFKNLEILSIANNYISRLGATHIANSKIKSLRSLDLANNNLRADGITNLFSDLNKIFENLEYLNLANNKLLNQGIFNLADSKFENIKSIKHLNLSINRITNEGLLRFAKCNKFYNLVSLNLSHNNLTFEGLKELANGHFGNLIELVLSENKLGDEGVICIANGKLFSLQNLVLENCEITDLGFFNILKGNYPYLENLTLKANKITDKGAGFIINTELLFLKNIKLEKNKIGSDGRMTISRVKNRNIFLD